MSPPTIVLTPLPASQSNMSKFIGPFEPCSNETCAACGGMMAKTPDGRDRIVHVAERAGAFWWQVTRPGCFASEARGSAPSMTAAQDAAAQAAEEIFSPKAADPTLAEKLRQALLAIDQAKIDLRILAESQVVTNKVVVCLMTDVANLDAAAETFKALAEKAGVDLPLEEEVGETVTDA